MSRRFPVTIGGAAAVLAALALGLTGTAPRAEGAGDEAAAGRPMVVKIHADWCGTCTRLNPVMAELRERVGDEARFVVLDVTDKARLEQARGEAQALGILSFFESHKGKTGTVAIFDASGELVESMKGEMDVDRYVVAIGRAGAEQAS